MKRMTKIVGFFAILTNLVDILEENVENVDYLKGKVLISNGARK